MKEKEESGLRKERLGSMDEEVEMKEERWGGGKREE